jgi:cysteine desulfurase/selenocysteine lyase
MTDTALHRETNPAGSATAQVEQHVAPFDVARIQRDFPILQRRVHGKRLVYLDSAATTQKPQSVIDAIVGYYTQYNANVHRGIYTLAEEATAAYEATRKKVAVFLGCPRPRQIVFTRNTTESLNLLASSLGGQVVGPGDEILLTQMEHHSNLVPWFLLAKRTGAVIRHIPITPEGFLNLDDLDALLTPRTKIVSLVHMSNVLGTINPVSEIAARARAAGALVVVDAAQSAPHLPLKVEELGADFVAFSSHKMLGPTGVGVLWGRMELLESMEPYMGGGEMIREVTLDSATWNDVPWRFEAGTPNIADVIAFSSALDYLMALGMERVREHEAQLVEYALRRFEEQGFLTVYGPRDPAQRGGVIAFNVRDIHPHDLSTLLDHHGVAIRAGHHCAQPLMRILDVVATARASFYLYNTPEDVDALLDALREARKYFGHAI